MEKEVIFLLLTIATELPVAMVVLKEQPKQRIIIAIVLINMITHPIAWHFASIGIPIFPIELTVILTESLLLSILFPLSKLTATLSAILMNTLSTLIGIVFF